MTELEKHYEQKSLPDLLGTMMKDMMEFSSFSDVTLICDDNVTIRTHKLILSSSSPLFKEILGGEPALSEIFLIGIRGSQVESILKFIYLGEVIVHHDNLNSFFSTARNLQFNEVGKTMKGTFEEIVKTLNTDNPNKEAEKITEVYVKEEVEIFTELIDQPDETEKFECDECGAQLSSYRVLQKHKNYAHSGKVYSCDQCDYKAKQSSNINEHKKRVHEGIRYQCKECDINTSTKSALKKHISKHAGILQFCNLCNFSTATRNGLKIHIENVHEKLRKKCPHCEYWVLKNTTLNDHIKSVHEGIRYPCDQCEYVAKIKKLFVKHVRTQHSKTINVDE